MKVNITLNFKQILGKRVDEKLIKENPRLMDATIKTIRTLCEQIEKYFYEKKIKVRTSFQIE